MIEDEICEGDDVWLDRDVLGTVLSISEPFKCGNILYGGKPAYGREYVVFVEEDEDDR